MGQVFVTWWWWQSRVQFFSHHFFACQQMQATISDRVEKLQQEVEDLTTRQEKLEQSREQCKTDSQHKILDEGVHKLTEQIDAKSMW